MLAGTAKRPLACSKISQAGWKNIHHNACMIRVQFNVVRLSMGEEGQVERDAAGLGQACDDEHHQPDELGNAGAGFPTALKGSFIPMGRETRHPKDLVVNADEMDPGRGTV